jgi:hypothetical protein
MFPVPLDQSSEFQLVRELSLEELAQTRYYVDVRAVPLHRDDVQGKTLVPTFRVLLEIVGGALTTPRLQEWRDHMVSKGFWTDLGDFREYRPATLHEAGLFERMIEDVYPKGLPAEGHLRIER